MLIISNLEHDIIIISKVLISMVALKLSVRPILDFITE